MTFDDAVPKLDFSNLKGIEVQSAPYGSTVILNSKVYSLWKLSTVLY